MTTALELGPIVASRARAWRTATLKLSADHVEPWRYGTIFRSGRYPTYYDLNVVRVEEPTPMGVDALVAVADRALAGLSHRLIEFDDAGAAEPLRGAFERAGWRSLRLLWMRHAAKPPVDPGIPVEDLAYDAVHELRVRWHHEDFPGQDPAAFHLQARDVALQRRARVLAVLEDGVPVAFAQLEHQGRDAEVSEVYVRRDHRGRGLGTAVTRAAIIAAGSAGDLWITADDEDRAKRVYERLGFRAAAKTMQFLRLPG